MGRCPSAQLAPPSWQTASRPAVIVPAIVFVAAWAAFAQPTSAQSAGVSRAAAHDRLDPEAEQTLTLDQWKAHLADLTEGTWITSNAEYQEEDGGLDAFGMDYTLLPGGLSARGCLWSERDGVVAGVAWDFFMGWDPVEEAGLVYQSSPWGAVAIGHLRAPTPDVPELVQDLVQPNGVVLRIGHFERMDGPDRRVSRSVNLVDGEWIPRRGYTWVRHRDRESPCPG